MNMREMKDGQQGRVIAIHLCEEYTKRLFYLGIYPDAIICRLQCAPMKDPILFMVKGTQIVLRNEQCSKIEVEVKE